MPLKLLCGSEAMKKRRAGCAAVSAVWYFGQGKESYFFFEAGFVVFDAVFFAGAFAVAVFLTVLGF